LRKNAAIDEELAKLGARLQTLKRTSQRNGWREVRSRTRRSVVSVSALDLDFNAKCIVSKLRADLYSRLAAPWQSTSLSGISHVNFRISHHSAMPTIAYIGSIQIRIYYDDHGVPHFHAVSPDFELAAGP
jgi:hypothetical protein